MQNNDEYDENIEEAKHQAHSDTHIENLAWLIMNRRDRDFRASRAYRLYKCLPPEDSDED